jgi:hypothetical protein
LAQIERDLATAKAAYTNVMTEDVPAFNKASGGKVILTAVTVDARR